MPKNGEPPWIELCVDNILKGYGKELKFSFLLEMELARVLYHEIGHHIERPQKFDARKWARRNRPNNINQRENHAEKWRKKLSTAHFIKYYWYMFIPLLIIAWPFKKIIRQYFKNKQEHQKLFRKH